MLPAQLGVKMGNRGRWLAVAAVLWAAPALAGDELYQYSTLSALIRGLYDGELKIAGLAGKGDFGIGTFDGLDGELIALDGRVYKARVDGKAVAVPAEEATPFAMVTHFAADRTAPLPADLDLAALQKHLDGIVEAVNLPHAIRIDGTFAHIQYRSVPKQTPPYRALTEVVKQQAEFTRTGIAGTLVGYRMPDYAAGFNTPGYHLHFISADRSEGGHVLGLRTAAGSIAVDRLQRIAIDLPGSAAFATGAITATAADIHAVESQRKGDLPAGAYGEPPRQ